MKRAVRMCARSFASRPQAKNASFVSGFDQNEILQWPVFEHALNKTDLRVARENARRARISKISVDQQRSSALAGDQLGQVLCDGRFSFSGNTETTPMCLGFRSPNARSAAIFALLRVSANDDNG